MRRALGCAVFVGLGWSVVARAEPLVTDRPTAGEASATVGAGTFQVEFGPDVQQDETDGAETRSVRTPLELRYGITDNVEVHLQSAGYALDTIREPGNDREHAGVADLEIGLKANVFPGTTWVPSLGFSVTFEAPVGSEPFRSATVVPTGKLLLDTGLPGGLGLGINIGGTLESNDEGVSHVPLLYTAALSRGIGGPVSGFFEVFGVVPTNGEGEASSSLLGGVSFLWTEDLQLDCAFRAGLTRNAPDFGGTLGVAYRL